MSKVKIEAAYFGQEGRLTLRGRRFAAPAKVFNVAVLVRSESDQPDVVQLYTRDYQPLGRAVRIPDPS